MRQRLCTSCGTAIFYAVTPTGKNRALDVKPDPKGNVVLVDGVAVTLTEERRAAYKGIVYMPHAARHGKSEKPRQTGLVAITGLSVVDEVDRLARQLMRVASQLTTRKNPDVNDCRSSWRYFIARNPGVDKALYGPIASRVTQIVEERDRPAEQRAQA